ncbi:MAG: hypothetical protein ACON39_07590 [Coraliomargaritaceae bacterium]
MMQSITCFLLFWLFVPAALSGTTDVVLIGNNLPETSILDGDFEEIPKAPWRQALQSPYWQTEIIEGWGKVGLAEGRMMNNGATRAIIESPVLDHTKIKSLQAGDILSWRFASNTEYPCNGRVSLSLVFQDEERILAKRIQVPNGPDKPKIYKGFYTVTTADSKKRMPKLRFTLETSHGIKVYIDWVDLKVLRGVPAAEVRVNPVAAGAELSWDGPVDRASTVYRSSVPRSGFQKLAEAVDANRWLDSTIITGKQYYYALEQDGNVSPVIAFRKLDSQKPPAPDQLKANGGDWDILLQWEANETVDYYAIYRASTSEAEMHCIAPKVKGNRFTDHLPVKGVDNVYAIQAIDFSGNSSPLSQTTSARVRAVRGSSFSDLIQPLPIRSPLRPDLWGADSVLPRDPENGVEDPFWSYWGGKVIRDPGDGKYHICIVRWPEGHREGHWAWPKSTVARVVSEQPMGPYTVVDELAYTYRNGLGHNATVIPLHDGSYALYSLIDWKPMIFLSDSMNGPWKLAGQIEIRVPENYPVAYRLERNLSGLQCPDGSFLFVTKAGAMMRSKEGILGPYEVLTETIDRNPTLPPAYRNLAYEDPTLWYDGVQYHMIINAFTHFLAVYLRSPDGIHWKYEEGLAYTPTSTKYEDGTRTFWYKVERPNVLQDLYGRATHLSLAAIDVPKADDYGKDRHSSKHIILPLTIPKKMELLNDTPITVSTEEIRLRMHRENDFDPQTDLDLSSLRFGGSETVNFGGGAQVQSTANDADGFILVFDGKGHGLTEKNFVGKLIGQSKSGELIVAYCTRIRE